MIIQGDCLEEMRKVEGCSIDFIVCDPPYGLNFMGKKWDSAVPNVEIWKEAIRVCKPGSMLAAFGGSRTHHHLMIALEQAGWEIRDVVMWLYGSGFPKSNNFGRKLLDEWNGYGTALKPAYEPIIICMKPLDGTFVQNAEKWGVAGINIDGSRVEDNPRYEYPEGKDGSNFFNELNPNYRSLSTKSRWPANLILDEDVAEQLGEPSRFFYCAKASSKEKNAGCDALKDKVGGGLCATVSGDSRTGNITIQKNNHPTVKPIALMKYIINLLAPPGKPILLDPFAGSGSTILAAKELGINAIGIEISPEYVEIGNERLKKFDQRVN